MHTEQTTNFSVRVAYDDLGMTAERRGVDAVADRPLDRLQLRRAIRALPRAAAGAAGPLGRRRGGRRSSPSTAARTPWPRRRSCRTSSRPPRERARRLDSLRYFGCGGAPVPPHARRPRRRPGHPGAAALRLDRGARRLLEPPRVDPSTKRRDTDGVAMSHVELAVRDDDGEAVRAGRAGRARGRAARTRASASSPTRRARRRRSIRRLGALRRPRARSTTTATSPSSGARRRSSSAAG